MKQLEEYFQLLVTWNEKMNLTGITEREAVYEKHFYDSLTALFAYDFTQAQRIVDIGGGAGFPGFPIKILYPHLELVIVDSLKKRMTFLEQAASELGLDGITPVHGRAEELGQQKVHRESYDAAISRAVARLPVLAELSLPFVKPGGWFVAMKGAEGLEEMEEGRAACEKLGGRIDEPYETKLPIEESQRFIVKVEKVTETPPQYPRKPGKPAKKPLS
ncbi:16S rRNA (guanine(527)-N(7))-methyltransferase RsmG [Salsuginibacillus halophilus]|nr:16S rRNA (guanine(527)-N(7))-methyltransferase RsmG [Salsuginibacillus halophilus]